MHRALTIMAAAALPLLALASPMASADVYRSVDAQGHLKYSDTPTPGAVRVSDLDQPVATGGSDGSASDGTPGSDSATASAGHAAAASASAAADPIAQRLAHEAAERTVAHDMAAARAQQCKLATEAYQGSIQARRLYHTEANGERHYLSDDEAEQQRVKNRIAMQSACQKSP